MEIKDDWLKIGKTGVLITDILRSIETGVGLEEILAKYPELTKHDISNPMRKVLVYIRHHLLIDAWLNLNFSTPKILNNKYEWDSEDEN